MLAFTALGLLIMPLIDIMLKIEAIINLVMLPFCCTCGRKDSISVSVTKSIEQAFEYTFNLNPFELASFEK